MGDIGDMVDIGAMGDNGDMGVVRSCSQNNSEMEWRGVVGGCIC